MDMPYLEALSIIFDIVGCTSITRKPLLSYRLSSSTKKSDAVNLANTSDWEGCIEDAAAAKKKKKEPVSVNILIIESVG